MKTILVLEDEVLLLQAITKKLTAAGLEVISCTSGAQALDYLRELPKTPDIIWLDYYLKDMNGLQFAQELKKNEAWAKIPIIVVSNSASEENVHQMLALGVSKYVLKAEYRLEQLIEIIKQFTDEKGAGNGEGDL